MACLRFWKKNNKTQRTKHLRSVGIEVSPYNEAEAYILKVSDILESWTIRDALINNVIDASFLKDSSEIWENEYLVEQCKAIFEHNKY